MSIRKLKKLGLRKQFYSVTKYFDGIYMYTKNYGKSHLKFHK